MDFVFDRFGAYYFGNGMTIKKIAVSKTDLISGYLPGDYSDAFECVFSCNRNISADDFMVAFWTNSPKWVNKLFALRDWLVKPFGIRAGSDRNKEKFENAIRRGESHEFAKVVAKSTSETIIGADDKHLKMYFSIKINESNNQKKLTASTVVHFYNRLGRLYFYAIYPFHRLIVVNMLKFSVKKLLAE